MGIPRKPLPAQKIQNGLSGSFDLPDGRSVFEPQELLHGHVNMENI
jgi:hypothetical protein